MIAELIQDVLDGNEDPIRAYAILKEEQELIKKGLEAISGGVMEEMAKEDKNFTRHGYKFEKRSGRKVWNFKHLDRWDDARNQLKEVEDYYKKAYEASNKQIMSVSQDGEIIELPKVTFTRDVLIIKN